VDSINAFDIYFTFVEYDEVKDGKERPVAIIEIFEDQGEIYEYPIYSYRKRFQEIQNVERFYEIKDLNVAGLLSRSFIDVQRGRIVPLQQIQNAKKLGHLSDRDISDLIDFIEENLSMD
jgi:hypothetical protein